MSQCGYRYYQRFAVATGDVRNVLAISKNCGPGYLEFWSPDCFCDWEVVQTGDGKADPRKYRTGPASTSGIYLPRGGELKATVLLEARAAVNEYNGALLRAAQTPEVRAKFYPDLYTRPKMESQRFAIAGSDPAFDFQPIPPAPIPPQDLAFPPKYCTTAIISSDGAGGACQIDIVNAFDGVSRQVRAVNQSPGAFPFPVGAWEFVRATNGGQSPINLQILWSEQIEVYV